MSAPFYSPVDLHKTVQSPPGLNPEPVPISTYQDTKPVPLTSYQENESDPHNTTQQEKDNYWDNGFNREEAIENSEVVQEKENGKRSVDNSSFTHGETDLNQHPAIPLLSSGQGLPYAPVDWPNPGDVWSWKAGKRVNNVGYHKDRSLILPQRLHRKNEPKSFASKATVTRYIQTNFPSMDVDAFFASFSWKIPALFEPTDNVDAASLFEETPKEGQTEAAPNDANAQDGDKTGNSRYSQRKRKPMPTYEPDEEIPKESSKKKKKGATTPLTARQAAKRANQNKQDGDPNTSNKKKKRRVNYEDEDAPVPHIYVSPMNGVLAVSHTPVDVNPEEFDSYLNSLDNILQQPPASVGQDLSVMVTTSSPIREYEWAETRMKISSLLEKDFPTLFLPKEAAEIAALATKLRKDPNLTLEEVARLKLIEEIPIFSNVYQENKKVIEEADKFFSALELNKAKVSSLKYEYSDLKDKLGNIQMEIDTNSETIRQIDDQVAQLLARRAELRKYIAVKEKEKLELTYGNKMVANSIPKVVQEVQESNSKKLEWECKKDFALKREADILSRFTPLKGFFF